VKQPDNPVAANRLPIRAGGHKVFGMWFDPTMGYRDTKTRGVPLGAAPESMYAVFSGTHTNPPGPGLASCCFDFGNVMPSVDDEGAGTMDALNFSAGCWPSGAVTVDPVPEPGSCRGTGPWVQADLENGVYQSDTGESKDPTNTGETSPFVTAMLRNNGVGSYALMSGDAVTGPLFTRCNGPTPSVSQLEGPSCQYVTDKTRCRPTSPYNPMRKGGALVLGTGGDNSDSGEGSFFEGALTEDIPPRSIEQAIQRNIEKAGYQEGWK
jgi:hypothetical protein